MSDSDASPVLLTAALGGLLCLAACGGESGRDFDLASFGGAITAASCQDGVDAKPSIVASEGVADLSEAEFRADCDRRGGHVEVHPHCGGVNGCRGISYDSDVDVVTEHSCKGANTCTGFSCVLCD